MAEEVKSKSTKVYNNLPDISKYKHHKVGSFNCEAEVIEDGKIVCCLHDPETGKWDWRNKGVKE